MDAPTPSTWRRKVRYHHHDLWASAVRRGREIVAVGGPLALTLRGLARDLGVTAPALVYHFGSIAGLREAVAETALEELADASGFGREVKYRTPREKADAWVALAVAEPDLYRFAAGDTWHRKRANGYHGVRAVPSPRRLLEVALGRDWYPRRQARTLACTLHGLALARIDGVPAELVARELDRAMAQKERRGAP